VQRESRLLTKSGTGNGGDIGGHFNADWFALVDRGENCTVDLAMVVERVRDEHGRVRDLTEDATLLQFVRRTKGVMKQLFGD
jgi:hypothetical protein